MKIGGARGEATQDRSLESTDVLALAADHGASRVGYFIDLSGERTVFELAGDCEDRQASNVEDWRSFLAGIGNADIKRCLDRMVADIRRVVAGAAEARDGFDVEVIVEAGNASDVHSRVVEQLFAARDRATMLVDHSAFVFVATPVIGDVDGLEQLRNIRNRQAEVAIVVAMAGVEPWTIQSENLRRKWRSFRVESKRIVDPDKELLR